MRRGKILGIVEEGFAGVLSQKRKGMGNDACRDLGMRVLGDSRPCSP